ncbi:MAG: dihydrolipoyl dehydrogenase [Phycisphaeraceae bacterium]|nr:dihydrolipoyl dehydrogenase [Phycisphaeraceae bacterium]
MSDKHFDLIVIGGGPGGYVGAIRAAQLGMNTAIIERAKLGGVCLNWGCIPSKALLSNAELMEKLAHQQDWGLKLEGKVGFDWDKVIGRSRDVAGKLNKGVEFLMKKNKITHLVGHGKVVAGRKGGTPCKVELYDCKVDEERTDSPATPAAKPRDTLTATNILIATGSVARDLPFARFDHDRIWGAREAMYNKEMPKRLVVVGAGAIGMEFGYFYHSFGTKVTVVEMMDRILPVEDEEVSAALLKHYKKIGMDFRLSHVTTGVEKTKSGVRVTVAPFKDGDPDTKKAETIEADRVLLAIGVKGRFDGLFDDKLGLEIVKDHIKTDYVPLGPDSPADAKTIDYKTSLEGVYAIGDVIGPPWLAHVASEEAMLCVERIAWKAGKLDHEPIAIDYTVIPGCTYCHPQVASVGFTERALQQRGLKKGTDYEVGKFPFAAAGKAIAAMHTEGFVKIIRGLPRGEILGAHIMGDQATELIAELSLARRLEATSEELIATMHAHPTMHEAVREAALGSEGRMVNA